MASGHVNRTANWPRSPSGNLNGFLSGLRGLGAVPGIAGRSPSYTVRQLYDFKHGTRAGADSAQMKPSVEKLSIRDMISLAAYAASLAP